MDDLVNRLRGSCYLAFDDGTNDYASAPEAADRIEGLEAKLVKLWTFFEEIWDSQGYDSRELHDLLKELDGVSDE